jgi:hypothetical protein
MIAYMCYGAIASEHTEIAAWLVLSARGDLSTPGR